MFDCLRRINQGLIRSYDDLQVTAQAETAPKQARRGGASAEEPEDGGLNEILKIERQPDNLVGGNLREY